MRKKVLFGLLMITLVAALIGPWAKPAPAAETIKLGFAHIWPASHYTHMHQFPRYFKMVEKATKGKYILDVKYYPVGTLIGGSELYDGIIKGIAESGTSSCEYTPGRFPVMLTLTQPGIALPANADAAAQAGWEFFKKSKPKEFEGVKVLYTYATGPGWLHSKFPIQRLDQMKGLKIRCGASQITAIKAVGGEPLAVVMGEVYLAAQKGIIDANVAPLETLEAWKHHEIFDHSTFVPHFYSAFFWVAMNWDKWKALPKDLQAAFDAVADDAAKEAGQIWERAHKSGRDFAAASSGGHQFHYFPDTEAEKLRVLMLPIKEEYIRLLKGKGLPGEKIAEDGATIMEKYNKLKYEPWKP